MTKFHGGPADGQMLQFQRHPHFLRVVQNSAGTWDVLNNLEDQPATDETVHVYRQEGTPVHGFWDGTKNGRRIGGPIVMGNYRYHEPQPEPEDVRENSRWQQWCRDQAGLIRTFTPDPNDR